MTLDKAIEKRKLASIEMGKVIKEGKESLSKLSAVCEGMLAVHPITPASELLMYVCHWMVIASRQAGMAEPTYLKSLAKEMIDDGNDSVFGYGQRLNTLLKKIPIKQGT